MISVRHAGIAIISFVTAWHSMGPAIAGEFVFHHEHILGTSLELRIDAASMQSAQQVEAAALAEIDRLAKILSRYDATSELMRWQRGELTGDKLSVDLVNVLKRAEHWRRLTHGAFDVRAGALGELWAHAEQTQQLPSDEQLRHVTAVLRNALWTIDNEGNVTRHDSLPISLDGLGKGYILDAVCNVVAKQFPEVGKFTVNIGGDLRKVGDGPLAVDVTNPADSSEGALPLFSVELTGDAGFTTSGGYRRFYQIGGRKYSHILDPRTGMPARESLSASVLAPTAMDADALSTALCVLSHTDGLQLIESLDGVDCAILSPDGQLVVSREWPTDSLNSTVAAEDKPDDEKTDAPKIGLLVDFTLTRGKDGRYRRPYVAVWLENTDGFPVKTSILWLQTEQPGPRWHRDLTRWYRNDRLRKAADGKNLIGTVSGATRGPGEYEARFDGTDDNGKPLPHGKYTLCIEVAREHGTYQLIRKEFELGDQPIAKAELTGNVEVGGVFVEYRPWSPKSNPEAKDASSR
jgi:thiamine biosynthesis lipoprotein